MGYTPGETEDIAEEDFTQHFKCWEHHQIILMSRP